MRTLLTWYVSVFTRVSAFFGFTIEETLEMLPIGLERIGPATR